MSSAPHPSRVSPQVPSQVSPPEFAVTASGPHAVTGVEVIALPVLTGADGPLLGPGAADVGDLLGVDLLAVLEADRATGKVGQVTALPVPLGSPQDADLRQVLLVGLGEASATDFRRAGATLARAVQDRSVVATTIPAVEPSVGLEPFVVGAVLGSFGFAWRSAPPEHVPVQRVVLAELDDADRPAVARAVAVGGASWRARTLASLPSNLKNPPWLAEHAASLAADAGLEVRVWDEAELAAGGFGGIVGVGQASATPPRLIRLDYTPRKASRRTPTVVLVGKGITFDTGGLSIKPGEAMVNMKRDMTGGGVVMSVLAALADVGCPVRVVGLVPAAENAVGGNALRPGDVLRHYGGRTTEVTNTDAEGRLVMADAIAYAVAELSPAAVVDVATLTGAIKVALGQQVGGLFASSDALAATLLASGERSGEPLWRFPLAAAYEEKIASRVADADNAGGGPGAITAALFLQHFTGGVPWAHLDIASVGDAPADGYEWSKGPTGFGARLLLDWLGSDDPLAGLAR
ncbi:leucyl aminopeptidase family protein [Nocardioides anomalus]|uniref:Probable cytosol aminopeptidase n=1 Tax=Nocardioides anomalus TaxID=2712223 RepID=A0A6G6WG94_9ACTN|nr:leucyl aminopeptidase family protein [Nocardioides anomalus]QIG44229.1 leucyl aminopeptidase family protein [Nocardioides anomalus]